MADTLISTRRRFLQAAPLALLPTPVAAVSARQRMAFHLAEYKKAVGEIAPELHWRVDENIGPDADPRHFANSIFADRFEL